MSSVVVQLNYLLALGVIGTQVVTIVFLVMALYEWKTRRATSLGTLVSKVSMPIIFLSTFTSSAISLVYSEVFGFIPCSLCWFQRVFIYPIVIISGFSIFMKDRVFAPVYILALAIPGAIVALYQHYLQMGGSELIACPATVVSCAQRFLFEFNYITFPLLAFSLFMFVIVLIFAEHAHKRALASQLV